jgi:hypothetical protein
MSNKTDYAEKLRDPRWQKKRLEVFERDEWTCQDCTAINQPLHIHHKYYEYGKDPWDYPLDALVTLCDSCHKTISTFNKSQDQNLLHAIKKTFYDPIYMHRLIDTFDNIKYDKETCHPQEIIEAVHWLLTSEENISFLINITRHIWNLEVDAYKKGRQNG